MAAAMSKPLQGKIALVTGASRGIGYATALELARQGAHVVALARTVGGLEELDDEIQKAGGSATLVPADIRDGDALDRLGASLHQRYKKLDVLIGNAGFLASLTPLAHVEPKDWDQTLATNLTANWRLIRSLDPLLKLSEAGRAVFITSGAARKATAYWGPYAVSKAALDTLVLTWAAEVAKTNIKVNLFNPGPIRTRMRAKVMPGEDPATLDPPRKAAESIVKLCLTECTESGRIYDYRSKAFLPA
jgi:NAD(P)-dependent dehydrogenase (short-subunit alcohol dehydrogenase family)